MPGTSRGEATSRMTQLRAPVPQPACSHARRSTLKASPRTGSLRRGSGARYMVHLRRHPPRHHPHEERPSRDPHVTASRAALRADTSTAGVEVTRSVIGQVLCGEANVDLAMAPLLRAPWSNRDVDAPARAVVITRNEGTGHGPP